MLCANGRASRLPSALREGRAQRQPRSTHRIQRLPRAGGGGGSGVQCGGGAVGALPLGAPQPALLRFGVRQMGNDGWQLGRFRSARQVEAQAGGGRRRREARGSLGKLGRARQRPGIRGAASFSKSMSASGRETGRGEEAWLRVSGTPTAPSQAISGSHTVVTHASCLSKRAASGGEGRQVLGFEQAQCEAQQIRRQQKQPRGGVAPSLSRARGAGSEAGPEARWLPGAGGGQALATHSERCATSGN